MANFTQAVEKLLKAEGGYAPHDNRNGAVNFGITEKFLRSIGSSVDPKFLQRNHAIEIYRRWFWDRYHLGEIQDQALAETMLFATVNMGPRHPIEILQRVAGAEVDGAIGPRTLAAVNGGNACALLAGLKAGLLAHYEKLAASNPMYADDLRAWKGRLQAT